ncbi:MAG: ATP-binding cassette domain-containing protein [Actinobacteria bacterium]|nr:ATP-binding cassette domain-containing protein [Actinomycetota bacterium]
MAGRRVPVPVLRHAGRLRVRRDGAGTIPARGAPGAGARGGRRLRPAPGPARGADRHGTVRTHPADPVAHDRGPRVGAAGHRAARPRASGSAVARRRVARPGPGPGTGAAGAGRLRRSTDCRHDRVAGLVGGGAGVGTWSRADLARRGGTAGGLPRSCGGRLRSHRSPDRQRSTAGGGVVSVSTHTVELTGVGKRYGRARALTDVDLAFGRGVTGLLGPNGAGKTTLLRIVATSIAADSGEVRLLGRDPHSSFADVTAVRRELGYLPQELGYPSDMTAFGFVEYVAVLKEWNDREARSQEVRRVLELVGLADQAPVRISRLSGGQRRRVGLAQALLGDPRLVVLDEPTTGLDPAQRADLRRTLSALGHRSAVLLSTHQTEDVAALCERVVVLAGGTVRFDGAVTDLVATAQGRVWLADETGDDALVSCRTGSGRHHVVGGTPPTGEDIAEPSLEDAYLLMLGPEARRVHAPG